MKSLAMHTYLRLSRSMLLTDTGSGLYSFVLPVGIPASGKNHSLDIAGTMSVDFVQSYRFFTETP